MAARIIIALVLVVWAPAPAAIAQVPARAVETVPSPQGVLRLREVFADATTYELRTLIATDKLFVDKGPVYPVTLTITMAVIEGIPVMTEVRGAVGGGYDDDGKNVNFGFRDIAFPPSLPDWYFDPRTCSRHEGDAPS